MTPASKMTHRLSLVSALSLTAGAFVGFGPSFATASTVVSTTQISYDEYNRPICTAVRMNPSAYGSLPASACTLGTANSNGDNDRITQNTYDAAGQLSEIDQALGTSNQRAYARYTYNPDGTKATETDANGNMTTYLYDSFDRLSQVQYPSPTTAGSSNASDYESWTYDGNGNKLTWRRRDGRSITYSYDALNRQTLSTVSDGSVAPVYAGYDLLGHVLYKRYNSTSGAGVTYGYDSIGRLQSVTDMNGRTIGYQYDMASNRTALTFPDNVQQVYTYDATNKPLLIGTADHTVAETFGYDNNGRITSVSRSNGANTSLGYDALGRILSFGHTFPGSSGDNISWGFTYSPASQIQSFTSSSTVFDYAETVSTTDNHTFNGLNQDMGIAALSGGYDARGNLTFDGTRRFTYDIYNRLLTATGNGANLSLVYDPEGRLAQYSSNGGQSYTTFLYDGVNLIGEYGSSGSLGLRYMHTLGADQPWVTFAGSSVALSSASYLYANYQGSIIALANGSGTVTDLYKYSPYGEPRNSSNAASWTGSRFRYTGQIMVAEAQLYYYKARVYDPVFGRFLQTDPIGSKDDLDLYAYTADDPIDHSDPTGLEVTQTYDPNRGTLTTIDNGTGKVTISDARSGGSREGIERLFQKGPPIETGTYDILQGPHMDDKGMYRLEKHDSQYGDDTTDDGRGAYREHTGTRTAGCLLITTNGDATLKAVGSTTTSTAEVRNNNKDPSQGTHEVKKYGTLTVLPKDPEPTAPPPPPRSATDTVIKSGPYN